MSGGSKCPTPVKRNSKIKAHVVVCECVCYSAVAYEVLCDYFSNLILGTF